MLSPVGSVTSTAPVPSPFTTNEPVAAVDSQQLQLERQLQLYNQQLAVAQNAARQAEQLQQQIAAVQQQLESRRAAATQQDAIADELTAQQLRTDRLQAEQLQTDQLLADQQAEDILAEQLRTDQLLADQQADDLRADQLAEERLAADRLAADQLAADQLDDARDITIDEPLVRPSTPDDTNSSFDPANGVDTSGTTANEDIIPPLAPNDSGRLVNTLV